MTPKVSGFKSESLSGFKLERMSDFVGIRNWGEQNDGGPIGREQRSKSAGADDLSTVHHRWLRAEPIASRSV